jgi:hypothetical protein
MKMCHLCGVPNDDPLHHQRMHSPIHDAASSTKPKPKAPVFQKQEPDRQNEQVVRTITEAVPLVVQDHNGVRTTQTGTRAYNLSEWRDENRFWHLGCDCNTFKRPRPGALNFCNHLKMGLEGEWDVKDETDKRRVIQRELFVPLFFRPGAGIYVDLIGDTDSNLLEAVIEIKPGLDVSHRHDLTVGIGTVTRTTGRWGIRELALEHLITLWATERETLTPCQAAHHSWGYYERPEYSNAETGMPTKEACIDMLDLLSGSWCRRCNEDNGVPDI